MVEVWFPIDVWSLIVMELHDPKDVLTCSLLCEESRQAVERVKLKFADKHLNQVGNQWLFSSIGAPVFTYVKFNDKLHGPWARKNKKIKWFALGSEISPPEAFVGKDELCETFVQFIAAVDYWIVDRHLSY